MTLPVPPRLRDLIDEQLFGFAQGAQKHYKTTDLVVLLDLSEPNAELEAIPRNRMIDLGEVPEHLRQKLAASASEAGKLLGYPS